jgi:hypothetical protein
MDYMYNDEPYTISADDCSSHEATWCDVNGGQCTVEVVSQLCDASGGIWYSGNGSGCRVYPQSDFVLGSFAGRSKSSADVVVTSADLKFHGQVAAAKFIPGCCLGLGTAFLLQKLAKVAGVRIKV